MEQTKKAKKDFANLASVFLFYQIEKKFNKTYKYKKVKNQLKKYIKKKTSRRRPLNFYYTGTVPIAINAAGISVHFWKAPAFSFAINKFNLT